MAMLMAVLLPLVLGLAGLGIDSGMLYLAHNRLQGAVDAAALAGSLQLPYDPQLDKGLVKGAVNQYMAANYPAAVLKGVSPGTEERSVTVKAEATVDTIFMGALGIGSSTVRAQATAGYNNLEVVFVIDNTGSMKGTAIQQANAAATQLAELIMPDGMETSVKVGLVPFRGKVHIPAGVDGLADGCRNADGTLAPSWILEEYKQTKYRYPTGSSLNVPKGTCDSIPRVQALTSNRTTIVSAIAEQDALGDASGTVISEGIKWGRHVLTPEAPFTQGSSNKDMRKVMIVLTDGDTEDGKCGGNYALNYTPNAYWTNAYYGMFDMNTHCENGGKLNAAMLSEAQIAKDKGIEIFAIRYGDSDSTDISLMKAIASSKAGTDDHYYNAPSAYDLEEIFKKIGRQLGWRLLR
ncbi:pilus assembly protein TadG-related protein [Nitratidesulfovibrio liaohensis]|uniref:Pilus assembly protein TadG-related protein n=1 Tax=Nitratidesulfovibrio liaohensis TaxID=2604158 RepID=A0ABY9QZX0_9BACT|nr:pilus assembly protein TadG-related protein [Nitratidesulfovibrio liaohensis]WMW65065.1 pilus assembly protein TadG-related protein [Nitratidesulfovibrio liaohensis]